MKIEPEVAGVLLKRGTVLLLPIDEVARCLGMTLDDFLPYLTSGELTGYVIDRMPGAVKVGLRSDELIDWMVRHKRRMIATTRLE